MINTPIVNSSLSIKKLGKRREREGMWATPLHYTPGYLIFNARQAINPAPLAAALLFLHLKRVLALARRHPLE